MRVDHLAYRHIYRFVGHVPAVVLNAVLDHGDAHDNKEREEVGPRGKWRHGRNAEEYEGHEEEQRGVLRELMEEVQGDKV